jgi:5-methylcytosine-specific restriction endonuclease McrA
MYKGDEVNPPGINRIRHRIQDNGIRRYRWNNSDAGRNAKRKYANSEKAVMIRIAGLTSRRYYEQNAEGSFTEEEFYDVWIQQGRCCRYCRIPIQYGTDNCTREHKQPISRKGTNWISNICAACSLCNSSKNNKTELEFLRYRLRIKVKQRGIIPTGYTQAAA